MPLKCGPLSLHFDPTTAALRRLCIGGHEIVQAIGIVVRNSNWGTVTPRIGEVQCSYIDDGFVLGYSAQCLEQEMDFRWSGEIVGHADGTLRFHIEGAAHTTFWRNRIGFCVLYPITECAGKPCIGQTLDGAKQHGIFPDLVSPWQPFRNLRAFRHEAAPNEWVDLQLEGDTFEMEDHRNWTDASYKIYSTPLELPFPVRVPAGTQIAQTVTLTLAGSSRNDIQTVPDAADTTPNTLRFTDAAPILLPRIGLGVASHGRPLTLSEKERLSRLALSHLRLDLTMSDPEWQEKLRSASQEVRDLGIELEVALFLTGDVELELAALAGVLERLRPPILRWLLFQCGRKTTPPEIVPRAREVLGSLTPSAQIGGGTNAYFAELNRERPPIDVLDCICYSINPQVHAFDSASLVENIEGQAPTVRSARAFCGDRPIVISPVTLKPRFNAYATGSDPTPGIEELPPQVDRRQPTLFAAGWTLGSLKALCESGVDSITFYETSGWRGVMETEDGSPLPQAFPSIPGQVFPMFQVFSDIGEFAGGSVVPMASSAPDKVEGMALRADGRSALLCANLTYQPQRLRLILPSPTITDLTLRQMYAKNLDRWLPWPDSESNIEPEDRTHVRVTQGMAEWDLPPFAYTRFDWGE